MSDGDSDLESLSPDIDQARLGRHRLPDRARSTFASKVAGHSRQTDLRPAPIDLSPKEDDEAVVKHCVAVSKTSTQPRQQQMIPGLISNAQPNKKTYSVMVAIIPPQLFNHRVIGVVQDLSYVVDILHRRRGSRLNRTQSPLISMTIQVAPLMSAICGPNQNVCSIVLCVDCFFMRR